MLEMIVTRTGTILAIAKRRNAKPFDAIITTKNNDGQKSVKENDKCRCTIVSVNRVPPMSKAYEAVGTSA